MRTPRKRKGRSDGYLDGQLLIAMPIMTDKRFARSVIYMCAHSAEGAMGLIINQRASHISFRELLEQLSIAPATASDIEIELVDMECTSAGRSRRGAASCCTAPTTMSTNSTLPIDDGVSPDRHHRHPEGDRRRQGPRPGHPGARLCRLARRPARERDPANGWLHCPADLDLLFDRDLEQKYERAMSKIGIDPSHLVSEAGHA